MCFVYLVAANFKTLILLGHFRGKVQYFLKPRFGQLENYTIYSNSQKMFVTFNTRKVKFLRYESNENFKCVTFSGYEMIFHKFQDLKNKYIAPTFPICENFNFDKFLGYCATLPCAKDYSFA